MSVLLSRNPFCPVRNQARDLWPVPALALMAAVLLWSASSNAAITVNGTSAEEFYGYEIDEIGDVNGDTYPDLVVGAPYDSTLVAASGSAYILSGADRSHLFTFTGDAVGDWFGRSVNFAGDVNNDGVGDVIVGAYGNDTNGADAGQAKVFSGATGALLYTFYGDAAGDYFGFSVSGAGDVNNDGYDDVIVGAYLADSNGADSGMARVFSGIDGSVLYTITGDNVDDRMGWSVSQAGDLNGDNYDDVLVGVYYDDNGASTDTGSVWVISGATGLPLQVLYGDNPYDYMGQSVSTAGDVNNDGVNDFIAGAKRNDVNGSEAGMARVYSGADFSTLYTFYGDQAGDRFGNYVDTAGDVNGDSYADLIIGANWDDNSDTNSGSARVFSGINGAVLYNFNGNKYYDQFGNCVSSAGDINKDGLDDLVVGAHGTDFGASNSGSLTIFLSGESTANDVNGSGVADALIRNASTGIWKIYNFDINRNPGQAMNSVPLSNLDYTFQAMGDFDGDTDQDLLVRLTSNGQWKIVIMVGNTWRHYTGAVGTTLYTNADWQFQGTLDVDGDGDSDVLLRRVSDGVWRLFIMQNNAVQSSLVPSLPYANTDWQLFQTGDFDGDGDDDVLARRTSDGKWRVFYSNGGNITTTATMDYMYTAADVVGQSVGDADGDGDADVLLRKTSSGKWLIHTFASGVATPGAVTTANMYTSSDWGFQSFADYDGDGDADVLMRRISDGIWRTFEIEAHDYTGNTSTANIYSGSDWQLQTNR